MDINKQICGYAAVFSNTSCDNAVMMTEKDWFSIILNFSFSVLQTNPQKPSTYN